MMQRYPVYKDSGFGWLGQIPSHWKTQRVKYLFREVDERSKDGEETLLSVSQYTGVTVRNSDNHSRESESLEGYKVCHPDDFVSNIMLAWMGAFGVTSHHGIVSPAYCVYRLKGDHNPKYFDYLFHIPRYLAEFARNSTGIISSRWRLYTDDFFRIFSILPPREEQDAIVDFIERETAVINQFLTNKRQLIALLEEQKQVVINTAVTQGLETAVPRKPSGIEWLGNIPAHWSATKMRRVCVFVRDGTHNPPPAQPGIHRLLSARNIVNGEFVTRDDDRTMTPEAFADLERSFSIKDGDIVVAIVGGTTGKSAVSQGMENVTVQRSLAVFRPKPSMVDSYFLNYWIQSGFIQEQIQMTMIKYAAQPGIYLADCSDLRVVLPPLDEQLQIVKKIDEKTAEINAAIKRIQREIELIEEYRTTLIAHAVTGKIDVRPQPEIA